MIITCELCKTRYNLDENIIKESPVKVRCIKCKHVFTFYKSPEAEAPLLLTNEVKPSRNKIISISNQKGGVAKTSTCLNLGISLALLKKRVLLVDFDVQSNLTVLLGYKKTKSFYDILHSGTDNPFEIIEKTRYPDLWLLPSNSRMALLTKRHIHESNFEYLLRDGLKSVKDDFDYILIDTPPSIEFFSLNALMASKFVIIPSQCAYLSMHGVNHVEEIVNIIRKKNNRLNFKVLITMYDPENISSKVICAKMKGKYKEKMFNTAIEFDSKMQESQIVNLPVIHYDRRSRSAQQYMSLAREIIGA